MPNRLSEVGCVRTSFRTSTKSFSDFDVIWLCGGPWPDMHTNVTLTRSKVKVTELLKFRKLHFSRSISSAMFTWSSKLMVDHDSTGPSLQLVRAQFSNFLVRKLSREFLLHTECRYHTNFKWPYFCTAGGYVTWSGMLVVLCVLRITELLKFRKLHFPTSTSSAALAWHSTDGWLRYYGT